MTTPPTPPLPAAERKALEELYRLQISSVRSLARLLGKPCPIKDRDERRAETSGTMSQTQEAQ
jgi:hypothetical protein